MLKPWIAIAGAGMLAAACTSTGNVERNAAGGPTTTSDFADRRGTEATARGGVLVHAARWVDVRAAAYAGFRLPTLNELYRPFVVFPITTQANADLAPERLRGIEGGIDVRPAEGVDVNLTAFYNRLGDAIGNVTIATNLRRRDNVRAIVARGIEASLAWRRGPFALTASYALSDSRVDAPGTALDRLAPAQSPRHAASATLAWAPRTGPSLSVTARYVGEE